MGVEKLRRNPHVETPIKNHITFGSDTGFTPYWIFMDCTNTAASTFGYTLGEAVRVIDAYAIAAGGNGSATAQVTDDDDNAITDAMDIASEKAVGRAGTIDDANWEESAGNTLKIVQNANADNCYAFIKVVPTKD